jgi:hypothetical protein
MVGAFAALALLSGLSDPGGPPAGQGDRQVRHYRVAGWRLEVHRDRFADLVACTLQKPGVTYDRGVLTFRFSHGVDTANALFRIDNAQPRGAGSVAVEAAGLGAHFNGPNLTNPSNGEVHIPADAVDEARKVSIEPNRRSAYRTFDVTGLSRAIEAAKARGCDIA